MQPLSFRMPYSQTGQPVLRYGLRRASTMSPCCPVCFLSKLLRFYSRPSVSGVLLLLLTEHLPNR